MIRYIESHDIHANPEHIETTELVLSAVEKAAREHRVDFVVTSDLHDKNFYLSKEYNRFRACIKRILAICPVVAVPGTPGHETEAMYAPLEDLGLTLLRPRRVYGLTSIGIEYLERVEPAAKCILFGIPELLPDQIESTLGYPTHVDYIREYIAPMRATHPDIPAILVIHGTISDYRRENEIDPKKKSAKVYHYSEDFECANLTRISAGHIHLPGEFRGGGFSGSWGTDWGETGFVPAMNLIEIVGVTQTTLTRIPYGTPRREKITAPLPGYSPDIAYWLDSDDPDAPCPTGHSWSRVTHTPKRAESRRITQEQAQGASLRDLFKLFDPTVDDATLKLVDGLDWSGIQTRKAAIDIRIERVKVDGCIFWQGKSIELDLTALPDGLSQIDGANGEGKSSLVAFCTPYPVIVGKDTKSGRPSAIKDFFDMQDSLIDKNITVNGVPHHHLITIKGAHTQNPKVECYLEINGKPQLERGTFDEMMTKCEQLYGLYFDYLLTTFYVQPLQGKTGSSLMSASMVDIRDLVQTISGIDREVQKRTALDTAASIEKKLAEKEAWIKGAEENAVDIEEHRKEIIDLESGCAITTASFDHACDLGAEKKQALDALRIRQTENNRQIQRKTDRDEKLKTAQALIESLTKEIDELQSISDNLESNDLLIREDNTRRIRMEARTRIINENAEKQNAYEKAVNDYTRKLQELQLSIKRQNNLAENNYQSDLSFYMSQKSKHETIINNAAKPCEHCGEIPYLNAEKAVKVAQAALQALVVPCKPMPAIVPEELPGESLQCAPTLFAVPLSEPCTIDRPAIEAAVTAGIRAQAAIEEKTAARKKAVIEEATLQNLSYNIDLTIDGLVESTEAELDNLRKQAVDLKAEKSSLQARVDWNLKAIADVKAQSDKITAERATVSDLSDTLGRWKYIAVQLRPDKIPAMELDLVLDLIDIEATRNIIPYQDGAFTFQTRTQRMGKKDVVDAFDIMVHDNRSGREKSFLAFSPGQKAFLNDAYVKALIRIRNQRAHITYSPIISDEADSPIEIPMIPTFYAMQERYYNSERVLVISHTPDARNYIGNRIEIKELIK